MAKGNSLVDVGGTGLQLGWGGVDDDFLRQWRGKDKIKRVGEMLDNSPIIGAERLAIELPIMDVDWTAVSDEGENDPRLALINDSIKNMQAPLSVHISESLLSPFYGWHLFAINYERVNGRMLWKEFKALGHETIQEWQPRDRGRWAVKQYAWVYPDVIEPERLIHYRFRNNRNNPEGKSILRPAWIPYYYVKNLITTEAVSYERNGAGFPAVSSPEGADMVEGGTDRNTAEVFVRNIRLDQQSGIVLPYGWGFEFKSPGGIQDFDKPITRHETRMLMASLAQFLMVGMNNIGARATLEGGLDFFTLALNAIADGIADTLTERAVAPLLKLNGYDTEGITMTHSPVGAIDTGKIIEVLKGGFVSWGEQDEAWLRQLLRMPERDETMGRSQPLVEPPPPDDMMTIYAAKPTPKYNKDGKGTRKYDKTGNQTVDERIEGYYHQIDELAERATRGAIPRQEFEARMRDLTTAAILLAFLLAGGNPQSSAGQNRLTTMQRQAGESIPKLADDIYNGRYSKSVALTEERAKEMLTNRLTIWAGMMGTAYWLGRNYIQPPTGKAGVEAAIIAAGEALPPKVSDVYTETWRRGNTEQPCRTCVALNGVTLTIEEWERLGLFPKHPDLECGGWNCDCSRKPEGKPSDGLENILPSLGV